MSLDKLIHYSNMWDAVQKLHVDGNHWHDVVNLQTNYATTYWSRVSGGRRWLQGKSDIMNFLIKRFSYEAYLEIGGQPSSPRATFHKIDCAKKIAVDPDASSGADYLLKSDEFFAENDAQFDIIFIDGLHEHQQVLRDIHNSLGCLTPDGTIILHDMLPPTPAHEASTGTGDCWRAFADLRVSRSDLSMHMLPPPCGTEDGLGIIRRGMQELFKGELRYDYQYLMQNINELMHVIDLEDFYRLFGA